MAKRILVVASLWVLLQLYVGQRLLGHADVSAAVRAAGWAGILFLALGPLAAMLSGRVAGIPERRALSWAGFAAMGIASLLLVFVLVGDALHLRAFVGDDAFTSGVLVTTLLLFAAGLWRAARPAVVEVAVPIKDLPEDLEGFRIVQLSDLHVGPTLKKPFVERVVRTANGLAPDLVALTGDVADGFVPALRGDVAPLAALEAPHGKFFVTGNHEYYWDAPGWLDELERLGFNTLVNEHHVVERGASRLLLAGITDASAGGMVPGHRADAQRAVAGAPASDVRILLSHQPAAAFAAKQVGFDLQLSGHTHGGQFFPFNLLVRLFQPFVAGLHRLESMWIYVSRGTGYWGPPLRLGARAEITVLQLVRA